MAIGNELGLPYTAIKLIKDIIFCIIYPKSLSVIHEIHMSMNDSEDLVGNGSRTYSSSVFLVEPSETSGVKTVGSRFWKKEELSEKSEEAINKAMTTIQDMAQRINSTIQGIDKSHKPNTVQVEFGLKFDGELDVIIARVGVEASISVTLGWELKNNAGV
jgi:hypothetical protein